MSRFMSSRSPNLVSSSTGTTSKNLSRKRKGSCAAYLRTHSQIEKRRRDKMNNFIDELASLVPACNTNSRKLDKLSVLRMTVQHMKTLRGSAANRNTEVNHKPALLTHEELKNLLQRGADGFLFVVDCDRGKILFVSGSVYKILNYSQSDLIGQSLFDYLHPKDVAKVKEQLSSAGTARDKMDNGKSGFSVKTDINSSSLRLCSGVRRSFFCRMRCNRNIEDQDFSSSCSKTNDPKGFCIIHSIGYLKSWPPSEVDLDENCELDSDGCDLRCLVAVGSLLPHTVSQHVQNHVKVKPVEFFSRHAIDGKFVFVDERATSILAYLPQELLGTSFYEYLHEDDIAHLAECHRQVLQMREKINTNCYKLKVKDGSFITLRSRWFGFMNPWTKEVEYIVSTNTVVTPAVDGPESSYHQPAASPNTMTTAPLPDEGTPAVQSVPGIPGGTRAGAGKIGQIIAKELLEMPRCLVGGKVENMATGKESGNPTQDSPTTQEVATSGLAEEDVF